MNAEALDWSWLARAPWQSTLLLGLGLALSGLLRRRAAAAHFVLVLATAAAALAPAADLAVRRGGWGLIPPRAAHSAAANGAATPSVSAEPSDAATPAPRAQLDRRAAARWALAAWLAGGLLMLGRLGWVMLRGLRMVAGASVVADEGLYALLAEARRSIGLKRDPVVFAAPALRCPAIWCWGLHPSLLLPEALTRGGANATTDWAGVFRHELAHLKRRDHLAAILIETVCCALWWHPLAWLARRRSYRLSDEICDAWAIHSGAAPQRYAETLLTLTPQARCLSALSMLSARAELQRRLGAIFAAGSADPRLPLGLGVASLAGAVGLVALAALAQSAPPAAAADDPLNLLRNGSMERGEAQPDHWATGAKVLGVEYLWDRKRAHSGHASLRLSKRADRFFPIAAWSQELAAGAGDARRLRWSAWVRAEGLTKAVLDIRFVDAAGQWQHQWLRYLGRADATDAPLDCDWTLHEGVVELPENTAKATFALQIYGPGSVWLDDVSIEAANE